MMKDQVVDSIAMPERKGLGRLKFYRTPTMQRASFTEEVLSNFPTKSVSGAPTTAAAAPSASAPVGVAVGASVGGVMCVVLLVAAVWRWRKYLSQVHGCSSLVQVFVPCS